MAKMMPPHFPHPQDPKRRAEREFFEGLSKLEGKWTVIYSLTWHGTRKGRMGDGEGDFVILHPNYGFFVAEVKGGARISVVSGEWFTQAHNQTERKPIPDPFEQALSTSKELEKFLKEHYDGPPLPPFAHFVVFPGHQQIGDISPAGKREIIIDRLDMNNLLGSIQRISSHWNRKPRNPLSDEQLAKVVAALRPSSQFVEDSKVEIEFARRGITELTQQQLTVLASVRRGKRLLVSGSAGTGKTVLAIESARFHAGTGARTLLVCYNRPLGDQLKAQLAGVPNLSVDSFHNFSQREIDNARLDASDEDLFPLMLIEAATLNKTTFEAIIIDEAQDFKREWLEALLELSKNSNNSVIHVFKDIKQDIYEGDIGSLTRDFMPVDLTLNCRNTMPIAQLVHLLGRVQTIPRSTSGPAPEFEVVGARSGIERKLNATIKKWTSEFGLPHGDVAVLTDSAELADSLYEGQFEGLAFGEAGSGKLRVDTIQRFKGLESEAVACIFDTAKDTERTTETLNRLGYIGLSRARSLLTVLGSEQTIRHLRDLRADGENH